MKLTFTSKFWYRLHVEIELASEVTTLGLDDTL